jgi:hypothetical protein
MYCNAAHVNKHQPSLHLVFGDLVFGFLVAGVWVVFASLLVGVRSCSSGVECSLRVTQNQWFVRFGLAGMQWDGRL